MPQMYRWLRPARRRFVPAPPRVVCLLVVYHHHHALSRPQCKLRKKGRCSPARSSCRDLGYVVLHPKVCYAVFLAWNFLPDGQWTTDTLRTHQPAQRSADPLVEKTEAVDWGSGQNPAGCVTRVYRRGLGIKRKLMRVRILHRDDAAALS